MINTSSHQVDAHSQQNMNDTGTIKDQFEFLDLTEVAKILHVSRITIYRLIARQAMAVYRIGRRMRFQKNDVLEYLASNRYARKKD